MKTIVVIGDVHNELERLDAVLDLVAEPRPDLVLLTGDVGRDPPRFLQRRRGAHDRSVRHVLRCVSARCACPVAFVPGNHDLPQTVAVVAEHNVDLRVAAKAGIRIAGFGGSTESRLRFPYEWSEIEAEARLSTLLDGDSETVDIFLSHTPPHGSLLDVTATGLSVGSRAVGAWIERARPRMFICGHIHEAFGLERIHGVPCLNAGALGEPYGRVLGWRVDWDRGPRRIRSLEPGGSREFDLEPPLDS